MSLENVERPHLTPTETEELGRALFVINELLSQFDELKSCGVECDAMKRHAVTLKERGEKLFNAYGTEPAEREKEK